MFLLKHSDVKLQWGQIRCVLYSSLIALSYENLRDIVSWHFFFQEQLWPWVLTMTAKVKSSANQGTHVPQVLVDFYEAWKCFKKLWVVQ